MNDIIEEQTVFIDAELDQCKLASNQQGMNNFVSSNFVNFQNNSVKQYQNQNIQYQTQQLEKQQQQLAENNQEKKHECLDKETIKLQQKLAKTQKEIEELEHQLWNLQSETMYTEKKGLSKQLYKQIEKMKMGHSSKTCSICYCEFEKGEIIKRLPCKHIFHIKCIKPWLSKNINCPNCRLNLEEHFSKINEKQQQKLDKMDLEVSAEKKEKKCENCECSGQKNNENLAKNYKQNQQQQFLQFQNKSTSSSNIVNMNTNNINCSNSCSYPKFSENKQQPLGRQEQKIAATNQFTNII